MTQLSPSQFGHIAAVARAEAGIDLREERAEMVRARLQRRLRGLGLADFDRYCALVTADSPSGAAERARLVDALTTQVGRPFRERHHFDLLRDHVVHRLSHRPEAHIRVWSAGCADGDEPCSIVQLLCHIDGLHPERLTVWATDISTSALDATQRRIADPRQGVDPSWAASIRVERHNLMNPPPCADNDAIFCRNVTIYFDTATTAAVQERLASTAKEGALYCLGHSERLIAPSLGGRACRVGPSAYVLRGD